MKKHNLEVVMGRPSYRISNENVEVFVTRSCGMMAPVTFYRNEKKPISPYYVNPWNNEDYRNEITLLEVLRGDFFCLPFGGDNNWNNERHPIHGETANGDWQLVSQDKSGKVSRLALDINTNTRTGQIRKEIWLVDNQPIIYQRHTITGFAGPAPMGHHVTLDGTKGRMLIDTSEISWGLTGPHDESHHFSGEYYSMAREHEFKSLNSVPTIWNEPAVTDCSFFPSREGFIDIVQIFNREGTEPAWVTATNQSAGYVWFALKDPRVLPSTVFWMENHGRHDAPWNGRNCCIGIEDVCSNLASGLGDSVRKNPISDRGVPTYHDLNEDRDFYVNYIQGVARLTEGFDRVKRIKFTGDGIEIISNSGSAIEVEVHHRFLIDGALPQE